MTSIFDGISALAVLGSLVLQITDKRRKKDDDEAADTPSNEGPEPSDDE
ncbi:hypothetical protein [Streptomyces bottropensis]